MPPSRTELTGSIRRPARQLLAARFLVSLHLAATAGRALWMAEKTMSVVEDLPAMGILVPTTTYGEVEMSMGEGNAGAKPTGKPKSKKADPLTEVLDNIAAMPEHDRTMAMRFHALIERTAPSLKPRLWYGMPAYTKDGKVLCFFQSAAKFKARYATFGFDEPAALDDGNMWPTSYALTELGDDEEARIEELIRKAMG